MIFDNLKWSFLKKHKAVDSNDAFISKNDDYQEKKRGNSFTIKHTALLKVYK